MEKTNKLLGDIRAYVEKETLSFIIGAGFSKNISQSFPLWRDLLTPLVLELYPECTTGDETTKESKINQLIAEKTYLGIASEYVRRKGYHEAIDLYIEQHMPYLSLRENGEYDLVMNGSVIDSNPSIECHKKLLALNAKHIFTFNYDNTLDVLADVESSRRLLGQRNQALEQVLLYQDLLEKYKSEYIGFNNDPEETEDTSSKEISEYSSKKRDYTKLNEILKKINLGLEIYSDNVSDFHKLYQVHLEAIKTEIERQNNIAQITNSQREGKYQLITDAYQISLTDTCKNIYKLHGNLRIENVPYGFDGDKHMQYVITQEDYNNYPQKHEAFVSLMRISLLKGCLCLIGFSGDDPNFMAWIDWVKDILDGSTSNQQKISAIYYINADSENLDASKELLLQNHYIKVVNLHECFPDASLPQQRISLFLDFMSRDKEFYDVYNESWGRIDVDRDGLHKINSLSADIQNVYTLSKYNRIPSQFGIAHYRRTNIFSKTAQILSANIDSSLSAKLIYSAIVGELMPIDAVLLPKQIARLSRNTELGDAYKQLMTMSHILKGNIPESTPGEYVYEQGLSLLFNLRFDEAKSIIDTWSPKRGIDKMRRYLLLSVYEKDLDTNAITSLINPGNFSCLQDYRYALDILPQIRGLVTARKGGGITMCGDLQSQIDYISKHNPNLIKVGEQIDRLLEEIDKSSSQPFGNIKNTINFGSYNIAHVNATKVLQILVELGIPTEARHTLLLNKDKWLKVCEILYERYPQPCLYFSLLYGNNKDMLRRIAQCYIYSIKLKEVLPRLLTMMLEALLNESCPFNVKEAIYIVAPIFMRAVNSGVWIKAFEKIYDKHDIATLDEGRMSVNEIQEFIRTGVALSNSERFKHKVLLQALRLGNKITDIHNRLIIAASNGIDDINDLEREQLNNLCKCADTPNHMYVLMNMSKWIEKDKIVQKLQVLANDIYKDCTLLEAACKYSEGCSALQLKLTNVILNSTRLWQTGIGDDCSSVSHYGYTLNICDVQQFIKFSRDEIFVIYAKLNEAFAKIYKITPKWNERKMWGPFNDWSYILVEMQNFLKSNKTELRDDVNYSTLLRSITRLLNQGRGGNSIASLLIDDNKTGKAISWLVNDVHLQGVKPFQYEYMLLANKILTRKSKYLNSCFIHFGWTLTKYTDGYDMSLFKPLIKDILDFYRSYFIGKNELVWDIEYAEKNIVERELCKMYEVYKSWGGKIRFWDDYIPRYYSK